MIIIFELNVDLEVLLNRVIFYNYVFVFNFVKLRLVLEEKNILVSCLFVLILF